MGPEQVCRGKVLHRDIYIIRRHKFSIIQLDFITRCRSRSRNLWRRAGSSLPTAYMNGSHSRSRPLLDIMQFMN
ncbi:hypothetical protein D3C75_1294650 [compost metagenome]